MDIKVQIKISGLNNLEDLRFKNKKEFGFYLIPGCGGPLSTHLFCTASRDRRAPCPSHHPTPHPITVEDSVPSLFFHVPFSST